VKAEPKASGLLLILAAVAGRATDILAARVQYLPNQRPEALTEIVVWGWGWGEILVYSKDYLAILLTVVQYCSFRAVGD
jgi:hypothetical protein